jgi:branched-chain amino acid aminotransferase
MAKNLDWDNLGFAYREIDYRVVARYTEGAWSDLQIITDPSVHMSECAAVLQYSQTVFEGLKAYRTEDGRIVTFRPQLNAARMADSAKRLEMPVFPEDKFVEAVEQVVAERLKGKSPSTSTVSKNTFSMEQLRGMSVEEINKNWASIKNNLK